MKQTKKVKKQQRDQRTGEELQNKSDHLFYEWKMLTEIEQAYQARRAANQFVQNLLIESFAIHGRNLVHFLYAYEGKNPPRKNDAIAEDYFPSPGVWQKARPPMPDALQYNKFGFYADKQIAHMVYSEEPKKDWDFTPIANAIQPALEKFISMIGNDQLGDRWRDDLPRQTGRRWDKLKELIQEKGSSP